MADENIKDLKKLKPQDRIKKLKALEEKRKGEITEIENLIKDSEKEIKTDEVAEEITPAQTEVDISKLFEEDSAELEATVKKEAPSKDEEQQDYISFQQAYGDYQQLKDITYASMMGPITMAQMGDIDQIGERLDQTKYHSASKEAANILVASKAVLYKIRKYAGLE